MANYLLGIDGGGSKTDILICDFDYNEVARRIVGRSNPNDIGIDALLSLLDDNIVSLLSESGIDKSEIHSAFAGIAGLTSSDYSLRVKNLLSSLLPYAKVDALHDGINVLYGAFPETDGVSVICGTGSSCFVKKGEVIHRIGGYGSFDMAGNGYEIGRRAVAHALKSIDGREKRGKMDEMLEKKLGTDMMTALDKLLLMSKDELASFAPLVFEAAENGDKNAMMIIFENISYVAELIARAGEYFEGEYSVALAGGILKNPYALDLLETMLEPDAVIVNSDRAPSFGAAAKAKHL
jgi:N-acetylglucosamine kinase-like BadF-type ATPase